MNDADGLRIEAAEQYGAVRTGDDVTPTYTFGESHLIAFTKACEMAGRAQAARMARDIEKAWSAAGASLLLSDQTEACAGVAGGLANLLETCNAIVGQELAKVCDAALPRAPMGDMSHGFHLFRDGGEWCAVGPHFESLQVSLAGFGSDHASAVEAFRNNLRASNPQFYRRHKMPSIDDFKVHE